MQHSNQYQELFIIYDELKNLVLNHTKETEDFEQICLRFEEKRQNPELSVMVYGVYNAGKSSFINALIGKEVAKTDDVPLTDTVTGYHYKNYQILDTPGIDAPIAHQKVADEQLLKSDVILFVVNPSGAAEEQATLDKLLFLVEKQKKVFLIFNEKDDLSEEDYFKLKNQTYALLQEMAYKKGLGEVLKNIPIYRVNAKRALKGKLENKQTLIEKSYINDIELAINQFIDEISQNNEVYTSLKNNLLDCINGYINDIERLNDNDLKKSYDDVLKEISACDVSVKNDARRSIKVAAKEFKELVESLLFTGEETDLKAQIEALAEKKSGDVEMDVLHSLEVAKEKISGYIDEFELKIAKTPNQAINLDYEINKSHQIQIDGEIISGAKDASMLLDFAKQNIDKLGQESVYTALKILKESVPDLMKGVSNASLKNMSVVIAKNLPTVLQILSVLYEWWQEQKRHEQMRMQMEEQRRAKERQEAQIRDVARQLADNFSVNLENYWYQIIEQIFAPILQSYQELGKMFDEELEKNSLLLVQLSGLKQKLL